MDTLKYENVVPEVLATFKGLHFPPDFDDYELPFVVVEGYVMRYLVSDSVIPEDVDAAFNLITRMVESDDDKVRNLLDVGVVEWFEFCEPHLERALVAFLSQMPQSLDQALGREFPERWPALLSKLEIERKQT